MIRFLAPRLLAAALLLLASTAAVLFVPQPALAQDDYYGDDQEVSFDYFYDQLAPDGQWFDTERWGYVWQPDADSDFRPYYDGYWVYTDDYGWYWMSDEDWGDIVYHYGRWVYDPDDGWLWVPGYVWGPAWVIWREGDGETGWFPMPPDEDFYAGDDSYGQDWADYQDGYYGYGDWYGPDFASTFFTLWTFVPDDHFNDRDFHRYVHRDNYDSDFFRYTRDATHYTTVNNFVVNRGIDPKRLSRRTGRPIVPVRLGAIRRRNAPPPTPVTAGRRLRERARQERPDLAPGWLRKGDRAGFRTRVQPRSVTPGRNRERLPGIRRERERQPNVNAPQEPRLERGKPNNLPPVQRRFEQYTPNNPAPVQPRFERRAPNNPPPAQQRFQRQVPVNRPVPQRRANPPVRMPPPRVQQTPPPPPPRAKRQENPRNEEETPEQRDKKHRRHRN